MVEEFSNEHFMEGTRDDCLRILWEGNDSKGLWNREFLSVLLDSTALRTEVARAQRALRVCQITIGRLLVGQADANREPSSAQSWKNARRIPFALFCLDIGLVSHGIPVGWQLIRSPPRVFLSGT